MVLAESGLAKIGTVRWRLGLCPKCSGDQYLSHDCFHSEYGYSEFVCLQCGYSEAFENGVMYDRNKH